MDKKILKKIIFNKSDPIKLVLIRFSKTAIHTSGKGFGIIVDSHKKCIGVVTDGDIRKYIAKGKKISDKIYLASNKKFRFANDDYSYHQLLRLFDKKVFLLPVLNSQMKVVDVLLYDTYNPSKQIQPMIIRARCPARVSFAGGGADFTDIIQLQDSEVLTATIDKYCTVSVLLRNDNEIHIFSRDLNKRYKSKDINSFTYGDDLDLIKCAIKIMNPQFGFNIETHSDFEKGTGLGGSSAMTGAVIGALNYFRNDQHYDPYYISDLSYQAERISMNIVGGWQDQYSTVFGGFNSINFLKNKILVNSLRLRRDIINELEYNIMLFRIGKKRESSIIQKSYKDKIYKIDKTQKKLFKEMQNTAIEIKQELISGNLKRFGDLLDKAWNLKKKINSKITNKKIDHIYSLAKDAGALGGKLLGAGTSGYMLFYVAPIYQRNIESIFKKNGIKKERLKFTDNGLEIWSAKR